MDQSASPKLTRTTCPYCGVGCGVAVTQNTGGSGSAFDSGVQIAGDQDHPANFGRLCSKGSALGDILVPDGRLLDPVVDGLKTDWDSALAAVASRFTDTIAQHGRDSVAFYVSGQLLTEDYYVANKLMKGFIGSANIDTNSRLCMASSVAGHIRAFGEDIVPGTYEDMELADLLVITGSNMAWCHPVLFQRILAAKARRPHMRLIAIDPRETATTQQADLHLKLAPGSDVALWQGLLNCLFENDATDLRLPLRREAVLQEVKRAAESFDLKRVCSETGLAGEDVRAFYAAFLRTPKTVTIYSQGVNQAVDGSDRVNAITNCHMLTGRIGKPGMGPFSITGQPNAMGGREVGGLANQLAAHMGFADPGHIDAVRDFWTAPDLATRPGLKAVDMFNALADGRIKAIWIMGTNPAVSMPDADKVRAALQTCPNVVVSDVTADTDTAACADILLPAAAWGEKDGTVTNSERRISRQKAFRKPVGNARPDWQIICDVARHMGHGAAFDFTSPAAVFREHAALSGHRNTSARGFDISGLQAISDAEYAHMQPVQWPVSKALDGRIVSGGRFFADGAFYTPSGQPGFVAPTPRHSALPDRRYVLNTGRIRDQWHTMTRTGLSPRLSQHMAEPFAQIHPDDARREGIGHADLVTVSSPSGSIIARALVTEQQASGSVFAPMHWTAQFTSAGRVGLLCPPDADPVSGQPALKSARVTITRARMNWHAYWVTSDTPSALGWAYWAKGPCVGGMRVECAGLETIEEAAEDIQARMARSWHSPEILSYVDVAGGVIRMAAFEGPKLVGAAFLSTALVNVSRSWAAGLLAAQSVCRNSILAGRPGTDTPDVGALVCSCMDVGRNTITQACAAGANSVDAIGVHTGAGTNCGSCRAELGKILKDANLVSHTR